MISLSSSSPAQKSMKCEEVKQEIHDFAKISDQNLVVYTDKNLVPGPGNISNKKSGIAGNPGLIHDNH